MQTLLTRTRLSFLLPLVIQYGYLFRTLFAGLLLPFSFAPFHFPGLALLGIALLFVELQQSKTLFQAGLTGFIFGIGYMGLGVSWIYVSIHTYGHLNIGLSGLITCVFIGYVALFFVCITVLFNLLMRWCLIDAIGIFSAKAWRRDSAISDADSFKKPLPILAAARELLQRHGAEKRSAHEVHQNSSTIPLQKFAAALAFRNSSNTSPHWHRCVLFSAIWCLCEFFRSNCFGGFPWLLLGFGQIDTPLKYLLPIVGLYGVGFLTCLAATCLGTSIQVKRFKLIWLAVFVCIVLTPSTLKSIHWTTTNPNAISVGVIQANLSMREKWDERLFWKLLDFYQKQVEMLLSKKQVIVMPESAIPLPASYLSDFLNDMDQRAKQTNSAILLGIPKATTAEEIEYYNTVSSLGLSKGSYFKQHLVAFGEYTPQPFQRLMDWLSIPATNMKAGRADQALIKVKKHPIATLICYELAYPQLLRHQLPKAEWIVSLSDDGWFGHSFAMYQQLQMAQALSLQTGRYQIVANNDGLSSVIDTRGNVLASLPAFSAGILEGQLLSATGSTPWVRWGDSPVLYLSFFITLIALFSKRRYPYQSR